MVYLPLLKKVFHTAAKWTPQKHHEQQAISVAVLSTLTSSVPSHEGAELGLSAAIRDASIIGSFTGSRVSEYAQSQLKRGQHFTTVPVNAASGAEGGKPIAFIPEDFSFFSCTHLEVEYTRAHRASYIRIRFRFTKGVRSFTFRLFAAVPASPFCPVQAAERVVRRWHAIAPGPNTPLFCFLPTFLARKPSFLSDKHMTAALRQAVRLTYPDKAHLIHQRIQAVSAHSLRVFACLCLKLAGWDEDAIAHQLRWNSSAIKFYIRQSLFQADDTGASLFKSALVTQAGIK
jgi:hypothetical protein